jgi:hypothetical protein
MDREELTALIRKGPVRVTMNDGTTFTIHAAEFATVSDIAAAVLYRADDGKFRHVHLPLVTMCAVEPIEAESLNG